MKYFLKTLGIASLLTSQGLPAQSPDAAFAGTYTDGLGDFSMTTLTLNPDGTFALSAHDPVFVYTCNSFENRGAWVASGNEVVLNPEKAPRKPEVQLTERKIEGQDSVTIRVNYTLREFEKEQLVAEKPHVFQVLTVYINKKKNYYNLVHESIRQICAFSPRIRNQMRVDSTNTFKIPAGTVEKIGIQTYGFGAPVELDVSNAKANYFEVSIVQSIDHERMPRSKKVIIKGRKAFYYEYNGEVKTSGLLTTALIKKKDRVE